MSQRLLRQVYYWAYYHYNISVGKGGMSMKEEYREEYRKFGLNVVYYRKKLRVTQLQLAELLDIQRSHISAIELGNVGVSFDLIFKMCEVFNIKPKDLFDFRD